MGRLTITGTLATTKPLAKYGGVQIPLEELKKFRDQIASRIPMPMEMNHRAGVAIGATVCSVRIEEISDGEHALLVDFEVDEDAWAGVETDWKASGAPGGLSPAMTQIQEQVEGPSVSPIALISDAGAYSDEDRAEAAKRIAAVAPVEVFRLFQFSEPDFAKIAFEFGREVAAGSLVAAIAYLVGRHKGESHIELRRVESDGSVMTAVLDTDDPEIVSAAIEGLDREEVPAARIVLVFDEKTGSWRPSESAD